MDIEVIIADTNIKITPGTKVKHFKFRIVIQLSLGLYLIAGRLFFLRGLQNSIDIIRYGVGILGSVASAITCTLLVFLFFLVFSQNFRKPILLLPSF
jgi:hypothetical protein